MSTQTIITYQLRPANGDPIVYQDGVFVERRLVLALKQAVYAAVGPTLTSFDLSLSNLAVYLPDEIDFTKDPLPPTYDLSKWREDAVFIIYARPNVNSPQQPPQSTSAGKSSQINTVH